MAVDFTPINILAGAVKVVTFFSDTFNRASSSDLGPNWIKTIYPVTPTLDPVNSGTCSIGAQVDFVQGMNVTTIGNNNGNTWPNSIYAQPARAATTGKNQFVQATFISHAGPADFGGIAILINDNVGDCYLLQGGQSVPTVLRLARFNQTTPTVLMNFGANTFLPGDILRLSADLSVPGQVTLVATRNGTPFAAVVDAAGGRLTAGYSGGFYWQVLAQSGGVNSSQQWRDFSCGIGL